MRAEAILNVAGNCDIGLSFVGQFSWILKNWAERPYQIGVHLL